MDDIVDKIDNVKEKMSSQEYKNIMDTLLKVNTEFTKLQIKNKRLNHRLMILSNRYMNLSTMYIILSSERDGFNLTNILDVCSNCPPDVDEEWESYILNQNNA